MMPNRENELREMLIILNVEAIFEETAIRAKEHLVNFGESKRFLAGRDRGIDGLDQHFTVYRSGRQLSHDAGRTRVDR